MAEFTTATFNGDNKVPLATAEVPETEDGWWVSGVRKDMQQSWERPFTVSLVANDRQDFRGRMMFVDTGEAFSYFEVKTLTMPPMPDISSMFGSFGMFGAMPMPQMPQAPTPEFRMPVPHTGRPEEPFPGISEYLDRQALNWVGTYDDGSKRKLWLVGEELVDDTEQTAAAREEAAGQRLMLAFGPINGQSFNYVLNKSLDRTVLRTYRFESEPGGEKWLMWYGAHFVGHDMYQFPASSGIRSVPGGTHPFGQGSLGNADMYDVEWMATRRFGGVCPEADDTGQFKGWVLHMLRTARLAPAVRQEMEDLKKAFKDADSERHQRDIEGLRQLNREMREDARRKDAIREQEDAIRRRRKEESDRRIREGWSAVNRGVEQYRGPNGELIEIPIGGPGSRAYYDRYTGTILHTDGYPIGWEELPRWQW